MITAEPIERVELDPHRWATLAIVLSAVLIAALDSTVLNVAIPTILSEFHTTLPVLQWVITGYSLTFAAFLIIGGRLGDVYGARQTFIVGGLLFAVGSLVASLSTGVLSLVIGEAIIEGLGASLMLPASLGILSSTFSGTERSTAFGAWGATMGAAVAFGPLIGGFLTTHYSWRWAFRINVIVAPLAVLGAILVMRRVTLTRRRERIDVPGALLIAGSMFMVVFAISEGGTYGWWRPLRSVRIAGLDMWPIDFVVSVVPVAVVVSALMLVGFVRLELDKERRDADPLFAMSQLRLPTFRYGLATLLVAAMGQVAFLLIISVFLQESLHLSALEAGLWLMPSGVFIIGGSQLGSMLTRRIGTTQVVQLGLLFEAAGLGAVALVVAPDVRFIDFLGGVALFSVGVGFASSQLTNVILSDVPPEQSGTASGANSTVRMLGAAFGTAIISALLSIETAHRAVDLLGSSALSPGLRTRAVAMVQSSGFSITAPRGTRHTDAATLRSIMERSVAAGARVPLLYGTVVVLVGLALSFLIPRIDIGRGDVEIETAVEAERFVEALTA